MFTGRAVPTQMSLLFKSTPSTRSRNPKPPSVSKLPSTSKLSTAEARELVERIAQSYGRLSDGERNLAPRSALEAIGNLQSTLGSAAKRIIKELCEDNARFGFELIKNAEDNHYEHATAAHRDPYIQFDIYPDKIVIDNNEDGFTVANVEAICKLAGSSKTGADSQDYIGEKGIGFKSVFLVATKVTIHSEPFSFFFENPAGNDASAIGMITPVNYTPPDSFPQPLTRITLMLRDDVDRDDLENQFFQSLPDVLLLFLKKLNRITVNKYGVAGTLVRHTTYLRDIDERMRATLTKVSQANVNPPETSITHYYLARTQLSNLPDDCNSTHDTAELCLAFPVDGKDLPLVASRNIYSYFPVESLGFHFLIHSDFRKQASWQAVMKHPRNAAILDQVAKAFVEAVLKFCEHRTLQYQWMRFLPSFPSVDFWAPSQTDELRSRFVPNVKKILATKPALWSHFHDKLKLIHDLRLIPDEFKDGLGAPLFADSPRGTYLAAGYASGNNAYALMSLGLQPLGADDVIDRVQEDLDSDSSKLKSKETPLDWHQRAAKFLLQSFIGKCVSQLKSIKFIPLEDGTFTSILEGPIYFPQSDEMLIPNDIELRLVEPQAIKDNKWRLMLFTAVGVKNASVKEIRRSILEKYEKEESRLLIKLEQSVAHVRYLYWTHQIPLIATLSENLIFRGKPSYNQLASAPLSTIPLSFKLYKLGTVPGTREELYRPTVEEEPNTSTDQKNVFQSMCFQRTFQTFSPEEHRLADYASSKDQYEALWVFNCRNEMVSTKTKLRFPTEEFGVSGILKPSSDSSELELSSSCLNSSYFAPMPDHPALRNLSWESWLKEQLGIRRLSKVVDPGDTPSGAVVNILSTSAFPEASGTQSESITPEHSSSVS